MKLPFTLDQFIAVFIAYNRAIWPAQILLNLVAVIAVVVCLRATVPSRLVAGILAFLWLWTGVAYHWMYFSTINPAAFAFGGLCVLQAIVFLVFGVLRASITFRFDRSMQSLVGAVFILYALLLYPSIGYLLGHVFPASPSFGAPCPTTIFTFGMLLWTVGRTRWYVFLIPLMWSLIGFMAAISLGITEDVGLLVAGLIGTAFLLTRSTGKGSLTVA